MVKVIDTVCGAKVETDSATAFAEYKGRTYYFCCPNCKTMFEKDPDRFLKSHGPEDSESS